jgi:hypothetical protein
VHRPCLAQLGLPGRQGKTPMRNRAAMAAIVAVCLGSSCSPYVYKNEVQGFAAGVNALDEGYEAGLQALADRRVAANNAKWLNNKPAVVLSNGCLPTSSPNPQPCGVVDPFGDLPDETTAGPGEVESAAAEQRQHVRALADYAAALDALTRAEDREAFNNAAATLEQSVDGLAGRLAPGAPSLGPLVSLFSFVTGTYLDQRRFVALRSAVDEVDPLLHELRDPLVIAFEEMARAQQQYLLNEGNKVGERLGPEVGDQVYAANLRDLERIAAAADKLAHSAPQAAVDDMIAAHGELRRALNEGRGQDKEVIKAINDFVEKAKAVQAAFAPAAEPQAL